MHKSIDLNLEPALKAAVSIIFWSNKCKIPLYSNSNHCYREFGQ